MTFEIGHGVVRVTADTARAITGLGLLTAAAGATGAALAVLPALGASAAGIGGVIAGSFAGVGAALKGYQADQKAAAVQGAKSAKTEVSNARQIRDAQKSIADARRNQARAAKDAARAVEDAERSQTRTARAGAEAIESASDRVQDALTAEREANEDLSDARQQSAKDLDELREKVDDYALSQRDAGASVAEAELKLREVMLDSTADATERERAEINLAKAREKVSDLTREAAESTAELSEAESKGVDGSDRVVAAQERVEAAHDKVLNAQKELTRTQRDAGEANQEASRRVAEAVEQSGIAQEDAARGVAQAIQGLKDAQDSQAASAVVGATNTSAYADAMAKLLPSQRELVEQLIAMGPLVGGLQAASADSFLPGLTQMLRDSEGLFPIFEGFLRSTGTIMGDTARKAGELFKTQEFKDNLKGTLDASLPITQAIADGIVTMTDAWYSLGAESGPAADGFASGLTRLFDGLGGMFENLEPHMDSFGVILDGILGGLGDLLPGVGVALGVIADALVVIGPWIAPVIAGFLGMYGAARAIMFFYTAWRILSLAFTVSPFGLVLIALVGLVTALVTAYATSETFRNIVNGVFQAIGEFCKWVWENMLRPAFDGIVIGLRAVGEFFRFVWEKYIRPAWEALGVGIGVGVRVVQGAFDLLRRGVDGVGNAFSSVVDWVSRKWGELRDAARQPVQWVVDFVYNNGIRKVWNGIAGVFGLGLLPEVRFATGGIMPGYTPGRDVHLAALSGGEAVMRPEWTRAAGSQYVNGANKAARVGGVAGAESFIKQHGLPGYAEGGIVGDIWEKASGFIGSLFTGDPASAVRSLFEGVLGDSGRTPGGGMWRQMLVDIPNRLIKAAIDAATKWMAGSGGGGRVGAGLAFAQAQAGKPYNWAGVGPEGYDCSGFMSAIANVIEGKSPYSRRGATGTFPWPGFQTGLSSAFMIGSSKNTGDGIGHMAGRLAGVNVESRGSDGVVVGPRARNDADPLFNTRAGMRFDLGGIAAGMGLLAKGTVAPERVLSPDQTRAFEAWMNRGAPGGTGGNTFHVSIDAKSVEEMRTIMDFFEAVEQEARRGSDSMAGVAG